MTFAKIRRYLASTATLTACFVASSASAAMLATNDFETSFSDFTTDETLATLATYNGDGPSDAASYPFGSFGGKYLSVDSDDTTLWRSFAPRSAVVYFDSYVKLTPMCDDFAYAGDAKFVIYLDSATSNLCVISGAAANDRTAVTNRLVSAPIAPNTWGRLTINATSSGGVFAFQVKLNGTLLATSGSVNTFYSLTADTTLSEFGVSGTGALDNFAVRTTDPDFSGSVAATIGGADGEKYATLEAALEDSNGATVTLMADHAGTVAVTQSGTYVVDKGSFTFGGIVGTEGSYVASSTSGNVDTYTVKLLVAMWDGAAGPYDFSTLTRTVGDITYTLNLNSQNTVGGDGSYVQIGPNNAQKAVTLTATGNGAFGTSGQVTAIMKCSALNLTDNTYRGLIGLLADEGGYYSGDNNVKVGITTGYNVSNGAGANTYYIANGVYNSNSANATAYTTDEQTICMTYNSASGTCVYRDGSLTTSSTGVKYGTWMSPVGLVFGGMDLDGSSRVYAQTGMKIEAIAVFSSMLSAEEVAAYSFPSEKLMSGTVAVSEINALFGAKSEITVRLADGAMVTGDEAFNASAVHFICDGSFTMTAPAGNTATFDFDGVTGKPIIEYAAFPTVSGSVFTSTTVPEFVTDSTKWSGVIYISGGTFTDFTSNAFGNDSSLVRLGNVSGWLRAPGNYAFTNSVPVELAGTLTISNGSSANDDNPNRCSVFKKLSGSGAISTDTSANKVVVVIQDASEFTGNIGLNGKLIVFGDAMPSYNDNNKFDGMTGSIWVMEGASVLVNPASGNWWAVGGIKVSGELRTFGLGKLGGGTYITTYDTGTVTLLTESNTDDLNVSYARISGSGTLKYVGAKYRTISTNNFPTTMTVENNLETSGLIHRLPGEELTIGSLAGNGRMRSDWGGSGSVGDRDLRILQSKDTTYSGLFDATIDRIRTVYVAPGVSSAGTLTLSGTQTASNDLTVESGAKVNLTGTWVGPVTVNGTLGGTGAITGNLTLADGATLKASAPSVSGNLTATGAIALELPAGALDGGACTLLAVGGTADLSGATFTATVGGVSVDLSRHEVKLVNGRLVLQLIPVKRGTGLLLF